MDRISDGLLLMNGGDGPDIACLVEVESEKCLTALVEALNAKLTAAGKADKKYDSVLFKGDHLGRRFAPGIVTRLPVVGDRTRKFGKSANGRVLEAHIVAAGRDLTVIASHWTSRLERGTGDGNAARRLSYAESVYGRFRAILTEDADAKVVLCGDFNDEFNDPSMQDGLKATDSRDAALEAKDEPRPLALFPEPPKISTAPGTIYHAGKWQIFDHILVSRGLLAPDGWSLVEGSQEIFGPKELRKTDGKRPTGEPHRFGSETAKGERGYSDHLPVLVKLRVGEAGK